MLPMPDYFSNETDQLRAEIAAAAARMIAEDGADYATAKHKAASLILGNTRIKGNILPDNAQVEEEVRIYNSLFLADSQPARLQMMRELALQLMEQLQAFSPHLGGAVLNGTAGEHSDIHLTLFADNPKEVSYHLLNRQIRYEISETPHFRYKDRMVETLSFLVPRKGEPAEGVHLHVCDLDDQRVARKGQSGHKALANTEEVRNLVLKKDAS